MIMKQLEKLGDMRKFSWKELCSDNTGKTSPSAFSGVIVTLVGTLVFAFTAIIKNVELATQAVMVVGLGAALLGVNKVINGKPVIQDVVEPDKPE